MPLLTAVAPELVAEWADERDVSKVTSGSGYKAAWQCARVPRHRWSATAASRVKGAGCPICSGYRADTGFNDLATLYPEIAAEMCEPGVEPGSLLPQSNKVVHWKCAEGHVWAANPRRRVKEKTGCPTCGNREVIPGFNDLATTHPDVAAQWDDTEQEPTGVVAGSNSYAQWKCDKGHTWRAKVVNRTRLGNGCPVCSGRKIVTGINDFATFFPHAARMHRGSAQIHKLGPWSKTVTQWQCAEGHIWSAPLSSLAHGAGCPVCVHQIVLAGFNDLATTNPTLASEWADENRNPDEVTAGSQYRSLWRCREGHFWESTVSNRSRGRGCPECAAKSFVSKFEKEIADYVAEILPGEEVRTSVRQYRKDGIAELDVFIPGRMIAIEANGTYYHSEAFKDRNYHKKKVEECRRIGIRLIQVWEDEWRNRQEVVRRMLAHKLGVSTLPRLSARKTSASFISSAEAQMFMEQHHIQGWASASYHLALEHEDTVVAVMSLKKTRSNGQELRLERYATAAVVAGGQSKLIRFAEQEIPGWDSLVTFADAQVSDGSLYEQTGWVREAEIPPDYRYLVHGERAHKFGYRLARFRSDPGLQYVEGMTESKLAEMNGLLRVWDSGKIRYRYNRR